MCLAGAEVTSLSPTQDVLGSNPFTVMTNIFTVPAAKLRQGNIFTIVSQSFCSRGGGGVCWDIPWDTCPVHPLAGTCPWAGTPPCWKVHPLGRCTPCTVPPTIRSTAADGTHPTGMLSCCHWIQRIQWKKHLGKTPVKGIPTQQKMCSLRPIHRQRKWKRKWKFFLMFAVLSLIFICLLFDFFFFAFRSAFVRCAWALTAGCSL